MRVLIVNKFLHPNGGSETYIFKLGEQLKKIGHEVQFFGMEHEGRIVGNHVESYTSDMDFHSGGIKKLFYPLSIIYSREAYKKIMLVLDDFQPDVVHLNNFNFQLTPSIIYAVRDWEKRQGRKIQLVYTAHDSQWVCPNHLLMIPSTKEICFECKGCHFAQCVKNKCIHNSLAKSFLAFLEAKVYQKAKVYSLVDKIICPSYFLKEKLDTYSGLKTKTIVMHNFIEHTDISEEKEDYVIYFGRYSDEKGVKTLLKVCEQLKNISFVFAGDGPLFDEVSSISNIENRGFLKGENLRTTIAKARIAVFPSECHENCPFSVMEAISYGTPVIGSRLGGIPELIEDGVNGILFEAGNMVELKTVIEHLWDDHYQLGLLTIGARKTKFDSIEEYVNEMLKIYKV